MKQPTREIDVLVIGSGAGGLAAALTASVEGLDVLVCEQADVLGGASAISGGEVWIPLSRQAGGGERDSEVEALAYLQAVVGPYLDQARAEAFVGNAAKAFAFIEEHSEVEYEALAHVVDYFTDLPGAKSGIRTLGAIPYDGRQLGRHFAKIRSPLAIGMIFGGMAIGREDFPHLLNMTRSPASALHVARMLARHAWDRLCGHSRGTRMVMGNALIGQLLTTLLEREVPIWRNAAVTALNMTAGRVSGATVRLADGTQELVCRRAVILANGSFSGNPKLREQYFPHVRAGKPHYSHVPSSSDGSGLVLGLACGGVIDERVSQPGAWTPVSLLPQPGGPTVAFSHFGDRAKPGVIVVNRAGRRFANEAMNYHDFVQAMFAECADDATVEAFVVTSHSHLRKYGLGRVPAFPGRIGPFLRSGYLQRGRDVAELARLIDVDAVTLQRTVAEFDAPAQRGEDPMFHKGETVFEQSAGDPEQKPNPCVAPLGAGPYYAIRMIPGDIASLLGLRVDPAARVLDAANSPVPGLYAVGTVASTLMGGTYPAAGTMLGPALTFGWLAVQDIVAPAATRPSAAERDAQASSSR